MTSTTKQMRPNGKGVGWDDLKISLLYSHPSSGKVDDDDDDDDDDNAGCHSTHYDDQIQRLVKTQRHVQRKVNG